MKNTLKLASLIFLFSISSCNLFELDEHLENPNEVGVSNLDVNLLMNQIQLDFGDFVAEANEPTMRITRQLAMTGGDQYSTAFQAQTFNTLWSRAYHDVLVQIQTLLDKTDGTGLTVHSGSARVLEAYTYLILTDLFGNVPFGEALDGAAGNFNPKADGGADVYRGCIALLDEAIALFGQANTATLSRDIYYGGAKAKWLALANTLKLRAYMNLRLTDSSAKGQIETLLAADLIDTDAEEFTYKYGTSDSPVRSRHPLYLDMYQPVAGAADNYIGTYFMRQAYNGKGVEDPRWRYCFFRQVGSIAKALQDEPDAVPCTIQPRPGHYQPTDDFCSFDPGFFGRDHGDATGTPPDSRAKTCVGVYPSGGSADLNNGDATFQKITQSGQGANGGGIQPIWMASFTDFLKAEAAITLKTPGDAGALMLSGVAKSIARVRAFATTKAQTLTAGLEPSEAAYTAEVTARWTAAADDAAKLAVTSREFYLATWGNGMEAYNLYRRTGLPGDMQPALQSGVGNFLYSLIYPAYFTNLNSTGVQKDATQINKVFWDNNGDICR